MKTISRSSQQFNDASNRRAIMTISSRIRVALAVMTAVLLSARPVYAEDIEIYLISNDNAGGANVLLLIDNSGGTNRNFPGVKYSEGGKTIDEITFALKQVLGGLAGATRLGVSSQLAGGGDGGAINYPVKQINEEVTPVGYSRVRSAQGDAFQYMEVPAVPVDVQDPVVSWKSFPNLTDAPDVAGDNMLLPLPSILNTGELENVVGLQFPELAVPRFAEIQRALISLRSPSPGNQTFAVRIAYESTSAPAPFSAAADFPSRKWSLPFDNGGGSYNAKAQLSGGKITIDVTDLIQQLVSDSPTWCGGQTVSLLIQGTDIPLASVPQIYSFRAEDAFGVRLGVSELDVEWNPKGKVGHGPYTGDNAKSCMGGLIVSLGANNDDGTETKDGKNLIIGNNQLVLETVAAGPISERGDYIAGARFPGLGLPNGATVESAILRGRFTAVSGAGPTVTVAAMLGDTPEFSANGAISSRPLAPTKVDKTAVVGDFTVDVTTMLNEVFNHASWAAGQSLGLRIDRKAGTSVSLHALDGGGASALSLLMKVRAEEPSAFTSAFSRRTSMGIAIDKFSDSAGGGKNKPASAYVEAARYMLGQKAQFAQTISHPDAFLDAGRSRYVSPMEVYDECGGNHIIMVTHAESAGESFKTAIDELVGNKNCPSDGNTDAWTCSAEVAAFLSDATRNPVNVPIQTHAIAFAPQKDETVVGLRAVAEAGDGVYKDAANALELVKVLSDLINSLTTSDASMAAPGVAVNQMNRFRHMDQLYYALFRPSFRHRWDGNLKRYRLDFATQQIVDEHNNPAVDKTTGFFKDTTNSWWGRRADGTDPDDGRRIDEGGARSELLVRGARKLLVSTSSPAPSGSINATSAPLGESLKLIEKAADLTADALGSADALSTEDLESRLFFLLRGWGDPLHTEPRLVNFGYTGTAEEAEADDDKQDNTVFVSTNDGMLHALDPKTGRELFSFMPREELKRTETRYLSSIRDEKSPELDGKDPQRATYGLDGGITLWRRARVDGSGKPEHVFLYVGQRRGGNAYYALNVTNRDDPKLMWKIEGGAAPFSKLGQTWSQPTLAQILLNGERVPVLIFGGGYSPSDHDPAGVVSSGDGAGNALYMVNAYNGRLIWSLSDSGAMDSHSDMKWAIPSSASVVDINFDGVIDYIYAADLGGQVFRVDLNPDNTGVSDLTKRVVTLAQLGTSDAAGIANHRRFHAAPVVALSRREGGEPFLQVALGSGYRSHPLNMDTEDHIFMIDDYDVLQDTVSDPVTRGDLVDVTTNLSPDPGLFEGKRGWLIRLEKGEKVLSGGVISNGILYMSTYLPESAFVSKCQRVIGSSRLYAMALLDGAPAVDLDNDGNLDRSIDLMLPGLPPSPQLLLDGTGEQVLLIGTAAMKGGKLGGGKGVRKTRWFEVPTEAAAEEELNKAMQGK
jgi:type IV pilus assembly protein PilY1